MYASQKELKELLDYDPNTGAFVWRPRRLERFKNEAAMKVWNKRFAGKAAGTLRVEHGGRRVVYILIGGVPRLAYRLAFIYMTGEGPRHTVDHIDGDTMNNRWSNLRDVTNAENNRNLPMTSRNTSGVVGVCWYRQTGKWNAFVGVDGKTKSLGYFDSKDDAIEARKEAEIEYDYHENHGRQKIVA